MPVYTLYDSYELYKLFTHLFIYLELHLLSKY